MDNITDIANEIFSKPAGLPNTIQLELEEETYFRAKSEGVSEYIFEILCILTIKGIEKLYGTTDIISLTKEQFDVVQRYCNSFGYVISVTANDSNRTPWDLVKENVVVRRYKIGFEHYV